MASIPIATWAPRHWAHICTAFSICLYKSAQDLIIRHIVKSFTVTPFLSSPISSSLPPFPFLHLPLTLPHLLIFVLNWHLILSFTTDVIVANAGPSAPVDTTVSVAFTVNGKGVTNQVTWYVAGYTCPQNVCRIAPVFPGNITLLQLFATAPSLSGGPYLHMKFYFEYLKSLVELDKGIISHFSWCCQHFLMKIWILLIMSLT